MKISFELNEEEHTALLYCLIHRKINIEHFLEKTDDEENRKYWEKEHEITKKLIWKINQ